MPGLEGLPAADLVQQGISDLASGVESPAALLVSIGSPRLRQLGLSIPRVIDGAERRLYLQLHRADPDGAHGRYNALVRRLVSFERALACAS